ncbi:hypothetical protein ACP275_05G109400 [Erythranthe tilingii]
MAMKVVLKLHVHDEKEKKKAMKSVSSLSGILSLAMDMKEKKLTVVGDADPIKIVGKLKKYCHVELLTVGPSKEPEKKEGVKKEENKNNEPIEEHMKLYNNHFPHYTQYYRVYSAEENPNSCVIC